jgi:hypothetical protein
MPLNIVYPGKNLDGIVVQEFAGVRQNNPLTEPIQQRTLQPALQFLDLLTERWL